MRYAQTHRVRGHATMKTPLTILILSAVVLTSCGSVRESRYNPFNWFGRSTAERVETAEDVNPLIPQRRASVLFDEGDSTYDGSLVGDVTELVVERRPGGAILRATGVADDPGPHDVRLVKDEAASTAEMLVYALRADQQPGPRGPESARRVTVGLWLTDNDLAGIRTIRVTGARGARTARR